MKMYSNSWNDSTLTCERRKRRNSGERKESVVLIGNFNSREANCSCLLSATGERKLSSCAQLAQNSARLSVARTTWENGEFPERKASTLVVGDFSNGSRGEVALETREFKLSLLLPGPKVRGSIESPSVRSARELSIGDRGIGAGRVIGNHGDRNRTIQSASPRSLSCRIASRRLASPRVALHYVTLRCVVLRYVALTLTLSYTGVERETVTDAARGARG